MMQEALNVIASVFICLGGTILGIAVGRQP